MTIRVARTECYGETKDIWVRNTGPGIGRKESMFSYSSRGQSRGLTKLEQGDPDYN
jgi:hypothetical protein